MRMSVEGPSCAERRLAAQTAQRLRVLNILRGRFVSFRVEKAIPRFELRIKDLQSFALPLGHIAEIPVL